MSRQLSMRSQLLLLAVLIGCGVMLWLERGQVKGIVAEFSAPAPAVDKPKRAAGDRKKMPVIVARVAQARNDETIAAVGTGRARRSVMIYAKSDGEIMQLDLRAGGRISKGQTIFQLSSKQAELAVQIAKRRVEEARRLRDRSELLKQRSVNSNARVVDAETVAQRAELELLQAEEALSDLTLSAPFAGIVGIPKVEVGDRVTTTTPIVSLDNREEILVEFEVAEKFLTRIAIGDAIAAMTPSHEGQKFSGTIGYIDSRVDPVSRTVEVRAVIPNKQDLLRPGMSFAVELVLPGSEFPTVPELSLQWRKGESYVWAVQDGKARKVLVRTVRRLNSTILVDGGLASGDLVVVEGVQRLRPGRPVSFKAPDPSPPSGPKDSVRSDTPDVSDRS